MDQKRHDRYFVALVIMGAAYVLGWTYFIWYRYVTFQEGFYDLGIALYSFYLHAFYSASIPGLQNLVFTNHISLFSFLILPIFRIFPSQLTLVGLQNISIALAALLVYLSCRKITKNGFASFAFAFALLFNFGLIGLNFSDFHLEGFIPLLLALAFYLYITNRKYAFVASYVLLLGLMETAPFVGLAFLLGLSFFEIRYNKKRSVLYTPNSMKLLALCFALTFLFIAFYHAVAYDLVNSYGSGQYANVQPTTRLVNIISQQTSAIKIFFETPTTSAFVFVMGILCAFLLFISFGFTSLVDPILTIIMMSPWLGEVFIAGNWVFLYPIYQYYAYGAMGVLVAAILGVAIMMRSKRPSYSPYRKRRELSHVGLVVITVSIVIYASTCASTLVLLPNYLTHTFEPKPGNYTSILSTLRSVPANASVMAQSSIYPHLYYVKNLELYPNSEYYVFSPRTGFVYLNYSLYWFKPDYIVVDANLSDFSGMNNVNFNVYSYMGDNYTLVNSTKGLQIYKLK